MIVGEGENIEEINFSLVRGGVITGKVTDADGRAVIQQPVHIFLSEVFDQGSPKRQFFPTTVAQTDDRGVYRKYGLRAGS